MTTSPSMTTSLPIYYFGRKRNVTGMSILPVCVSLCTARSLSWICRTLAHFYIQLYLLNSTCMYELVKLLESVMVYCTSGMLPCICESGREWIVWFSVPLTFSDAILAHFHSKEALLAWPNPVTMAPLWDDIPPQPLGPHQPGFHEKYWSSFATNFLRKSRHIPITVQHM